MIERLFTDMIQMKAVMGGVLFDKDGEVGLVELPDVFSIDLIFDAVESYLEIMGPMEANLSRGRFAHGIVRFDHGVLVVLFVGRYGALFLCRSDIDLELMRVSLNVFAYRVRRTIDQETGLSREIPVLSDRGRPEGHEERANNGQSKNYEKYSKNSDIGSEPSQSETTDSDHIKQELLSLLSWFIGDPAYEVLQKECDALGLHERASSKVALRLLVTALGSHVPRQERELFLRKATDFLNARFGL